MEENRASWAKVAEAATVGGASLAHSITKVGEMESVDLAPGGKGVGAGVSILEEIRIAI